jgi:hypothetical protein
MKEGVLAEWFTGRDTSPLRSDECQTWARARGVKAAKAASAASVALTPLSTPITFGIGASRVCHRDYAGAVASRSLRQQDQASGRAGATPRVTHGATLEVSKGGSLLPAVRGDTFTHSGNDSISSLRQLADLVRRFRVVALRRCSVVCRRQIEKGHVVRDGDFYVPGPPT